MALIAANSTFFNQYETLWNTKLSIGLGSWTIEKDLQHWVNDALMTFFFLVVGLELKRELVEGELRRLRTAALPFAAALGGMIIPAFIYLAFNMNTKAASGWAIPMATDIALAIGILTLAGKLIPASVRLFLLTLAIVDDVGAVMIVALFYNQGIHLWLLAVAAVLSIIVIVLANLKRLTMPIYIMFCIVLWLIINASGVHASISGALMGLLAPLATSKPSYKSIASHVEHAVIPISTFIVVPLFTFANTGIVLSFSSFEVENNVRIAAGIIFGLVIGKVFGIVSASWLMIRLNLADLPEGSRWSHMIGLGLLAGIGFTVSIFVTELAFDQGALVDLSKLSIFVASALSGVMGLALLKYRNQKFR